MEWEPDSASAVCRVCSRKWGIFSNRRHHCRKCGKLVCNKCSRARIKLAPKDQKAVRACDECLRPPPPVLVHPIEFVRAKTRIPFSDESPTLLGSPEAIFRKSLIADNARVASVIEESERSLLMDLSNATGNGANESALLGAVGAEEEDDVDVDDSRDSEVDASEGNTPGTPAGTLLEVEELSSHWSVPLSHPSQNSPKSEGEQSFATVSTEPTEALASIKEGVDTKTRLSTGGKDLKLSISKFGAMTFSDEERSAPPSTMSTYGSRITDFPLSPEALNVAESGKGFAGAPPAAAVVETAESGVSGGEKVDEAVQTSTEGVNEAATSSVVTDKTDAETAETGDAVTQTTPALNVPVNNADLTVNTTDAASPANPGSIFSPIEKPKGRIVTKKTTPAPDRNPPVGKLTPGLSPLPPGNNVRRLSTLSLAGRSPYNSNSTPSTDAVAVATRGTNGSTPSPTEGVQGGGAEGVSVVSAGGAIAAEVATEATSENKVVDSTPVKVATTETVVSSVFPSIEKETASAPVEAVEVTANKLTTSTATTATGDVPASTHQQSTADSECDDTESDANTSRDVSVDLLVSRTASNSGANPNPNSNHSSAHSFGSEGFVAENKKSKGGKNHHNHKSRALKK